MNTNFETLKTTFDFNERLIALDGNGRQPLILRLLANWGHGLPQRLLGFTSHGMYSKVLFLFHSIMFHSTARVL